jgi:hypothetical protein
MEGVLLSALGGPGSPHQVRPVMELSDLDAQARFLQVNSIKKSTVKGYATGAQDYISFCIAHSLPLDPTPSTLSRYIAYTSQFIASGPKYLTGARHFLNELYPDFDRNRSDPLVQATISGSCKIRADPVRRKQPLRTCHLEAFLLIAQETNSYDNLLFAVILSCTFYACHQIGELVLKSDKSLLDWRKVIKRGSLSFSANRATYHLPYHKSDRFYQGTDILFTTQEIADPVRLLQDYVAARNSLHGAKTALFLTQDGTIPSRHWFDKRFFARLDRSFGGHSACAGSATFYASLGLSEDIIQALGRWSSQSWRIYIHDNPSIQAEAQLAAIRLHH